MNSYQDEKNETDIRFLYSTIRFLPWNVVSSTVEYCVNGCTSHSWLRKRFMKRFRNHECGVQPLTQKLQQQLHFFRKLRAFNVDPTFISSPSLL